MHLPGPIRFLREIQHVAGDFRGVLRQTKIVITAGDGFAHFESYLRLILQFRRCARSRPGEQLYHDTAVL